jgi:hypothetical protein
MLSFNRGIVVLLVIGLSLSLFGQGYVQQVGTAGSVDWSNQMIRATGIGVKSVKVSI